MNSRYCIRAKVYGRVQGVAFRAYTRQSAVELGVLGWVRNCSDGTVEVLAEGQQADVEQFLNWLQVGSPFSQVSKVEYNEESKPDKFSSFEIRYSR
nr:acylphosphatase [uncultured Desulfobulbus sp.]